VATLACVAGWVHIPASIAGAASTGHEAASASVVRRLSARPCASLAIVFAVAGAITSRSAAWASPTCAMCVGSPSPGAAHRSAYTGRPVSAWKVSGATKRIAASVITTSTRAPACVRWLASVQAL
jgi:hypothetical protein